MRRLLMVACFGCFTFPAWAQTAPALKLSPNPFSGKLHISLTNLSSDTVSMDLYDINGDTIRHFFENLVLDQSIHLVYNGDSLPGGIYLIHTVINDSSFTSKAIKVKSYTGLFEKTDMEDFQLFPNPAGDFVRIQSTKQIERVEVLNSSGRLVSTFRSSFQNLDTSGLPAGVYFFKIFTRDEVLVREVIRK